MSEVPQLEHVNKKNRAPRNDQFLFILYKKMSFLGSPKGTDWCRRTMKKNYFAMKTNGILVFLKKRMNMFTWDLYSMYVVLQGIGSECIKAFQAHYIPKGTPTTGVIELLKKK